MKKLFLPLIAVLIVGCTSELPDGPELQISPVEEASNNGLLIDQQSRTLDSYDAVKVATLFLQKENGKSRSDVLISNPEVETVVDETTGDALMYVMNWPGNGGFVIVSASKTTPPILAFSDSGRFDVGEESPTSELLDGLKTGVRIMAEQATDSLYRANAMNWALYEKAAASPVKSRSISYELQTKIDKKIAKMKAEGWNYAGNITAARYRLPDSEYEALYRDAQQFSDPQYDIEEVSLCFIKDEKPNTVGPLLNTHWHQESPYNCVPIVREYHLKKPVAGCAPIAIAQIANYYRFPTKYKWDDLYNYTSNGIPYNLYELMNDISNYCNASFKEGKTSVTPENAAIALQKLGFKNANLTNVSLSLMKSMITSKKPFYMRGGGSEGHAWVCDGYQEWRFPGVISVVGNSWAQKMPLEYDSETGYFDISFNYYNKNQSAAIPDYFHLNLGYGENNDCWAYYFDNTVKIPEYLTNQKIIPITLP